MIAAVRTRGAQWLCGACAFVLTSGLASGSSEAQVNDGRVSFTTGVDFSHAYFFRGIRQEREGFIGQPYGDINFDFYSNPEGQGITGVSFTLGQWNSLHSASTGADEMSDNVPGWYESDFYTGVTLVIDNWEAGIVYTAYTSPSHAFGTTQELALSLQMDDSGLLGGFSLFPHALLAIETGGGADGGADEGIYLELGIEPGLTLVEDAASVSFPVTLGFSLGNYYENGLPDGAPGHFRDGFGFFGVGAMVAVPLPVAEGFGAWELAGGVQLLALGGYLEALNDGDQAQVVGLLGISIGY